MAAVPGRSAAAIALHAYGRYVAQLTALSVIAFAPVIYLALKVPAPASLDQMNGVMRTPWLLAGVAWMVQLTVVGAAAPLVHAIARNAPLSQKVAARSAIVGFARGVFPAGLAVAAVIAGLLAFVAPGLALLGLFSLSSAVGAMTPGAALPAQLRESAALVRRAPVPVGIVVLAMLAFDVLVVVAAKAMLVTGPIGKAPTPAQLAGAGQIALVSVAAIVIVTPIAACALATIHARRAS